MLKGEAYKLKDPYTHTDGTVYDTGWVHQVNDSTVVILLEPGIRNEGIRQQIKVIQGKAIRQTDLLVEFNIEHIGEKLPFAFGGVYAEQSTFASEHPSKIGSKLSEFKDL